MGLQMQSQPLLSGSADESLALSPDGKYVRRKRKYERLSAVELGFCKATKAVQISLQFAGGSKHAGVMVPADVRYGLKTHQAHDCWQSITTGTNGQSQHAVCANGVLQRY